MDAQGVLDDFDGRLHIGCGREVRIAVVLACRGNGESIAPIGFGRPYAEGSHHARYQWQSCTGGDADLREEYIAGGIKLFSGAQKRGDICFDVASNDVSTLEMHLDAASTLNGTRVPSVTFALQRP